ncbi:MAG TPA: flagellar biosynthetic protein FliP, partial [Fimbriimonadaceae bacterium]|nr:flagellar biosynthetic protein FliP [Fimbriimonadaceae bacterium]
MKLRRTPILRLTLVFLLVAVAGLAVAQQGLPIPSVSLGVNQAKGQNDVASSLQILALLTVLSLAPAILILTTSFSRIVIIFSFLRSALGTPTIPPNQVVIGLSLFLTFFVMGPTYKQINDDALQPY